MDMTKYRVDRVITGVYAGPLAKRHCTALRHATNYRQVAGDAGAQTVGADVLFECPCCLGCHDNGTYDWLVSLRKLMNDPYPATAQRVRELPTWQVCGRRGRRRLEQ